MTTLYIIEQGSYSDYRVVGIFSTRENAEKVFEYMKSKDSDSYDEPTITERILDPGVTELNAGLYPFTVTYNRYFNHERVFVDPNHYPNDTDISDAHHTQHDIYHIWARDTDHALKIAVDRHTQYLATKAGLV